MPSGRPTARCLGLRFLVNPTPPCVPVSPDDHREIATLLACAFAPSTYETRLVAALRLARRELLEWVVRDSGLIVAHVAFTRAYRAVAPIGWHLAPVSVLPGYQERGLGTALIRHALQDSRLAASPLFVLGPPRYYARFGFTRIAQPACPFDAGNEHFQALRWSNADAFTVGYEPEFLNPDAPV